MANIEGIRAAGRYLLEFLKKEKKVSYSRFYNRDPQSEEQLAKAALPYLVERDEHDERYLHEMGHVLLEYAAWQLEDLGLLQITSLPSKLIDGEQDFDIRLTERGERIQLDDLPFEFRDCEYSINSLPASEWLVELVRAGEGNQLNLHQVMETGESDGDVMIRDDYQNVYRFGTGSYAWAFEVALWHHAKAGYVQPLPKSPEEQSIWSRFVSSSGRPDCPSIFEPHPLWAINFKLNDSLYDAASQVRHVGRVS